MKCYKDLIVTGSKDTLIKIWARDPNQKNSTRQKDNFYVVHTLKGHTHPIDCVEFVSDHELISACLLDNTVVVWSKEGINWKVKQTIREHRQPYVVRKAFAGQFVSGGMCDYQVVVWSCKLGEWTKDYQVDVESMSGIFCIEVNHAVDKMAVGGGGKDEKGLIQLCH